MITRIKDQQPLSEWTPVSWVFKGEWSEFVQAIWPNLLVHRSLLVGKPTAGDPLAALGRFTMEAARIRKNYTHEGCVTVDGEVSPWLEVGVLQDYMLIQWPNYFRKTSDGKTT